jgi:DNA-3-methyladenine glycosylase II
MERLHTECDLEAAVARLVAVEPRFAGVVARHGIPSLRHVRPGLGSLLRIVTDQLISLRAGEAIWSRLEGALSTIDAESVLALPEERLKALGLSTAKARTFHAAARTLAAGGWDGDLPLEEVLRRLTAIPGIGPWTAHVYLLTACRAADAWPAADLALRKAAFDLFSFDALPESRDMTQLAAPWRPWRGAAALLLWSHYRGLKGLPQA